jgi:1,4-alpha-glucan branching enzyme
MRRRLLADFAQWTKDYQGDALRVDAYTRAQRLHKLLHAVAPIEAEAERLISDDSHLREFIGGSQYEY